MEIIGIGAISSLASTIATYPYDNLRHNIQNRSVWQLSPYSGILKQLPLAVIRGAIISGGYGYIHKYGNEFRVPYWCAHLAGSGLSAIGFAGCNYIYELATWKLQPRNAIPKPRIQWLQIPNIIILLSTYSGIRRNCSQDNNFLKYFSIGGISGMASVAFYYPASRYQFWWENSIMLDVQYNARRCWEYMRKNKLFYNGASWHFYGAFWRCSILFGVLEYLTRMSGDELW